MRYGPRAWRYNGHDLDETGFRATGPAADRIVLLPDGPDIALPARHLFHPQTGERIT
jgi:hypothetical protein